MIMKLPEDILFASGSAELSDKGKAALSEVANNLKTLPERNFMVAGHTDNIPPSKYAQYRSNQSALAKILMIPTPSAGGSDLGGRARFSFVEHLHRVMGSPWDHGSRGRV